MITPQTRKMILAWPLEVKLNALRELQKAGEYGQLMHVMTVLLDAPLREGGVSSDVMQEALNQKPES